MFWPIFWFEVKYQLRRPATWLYFAILFLLAFGFLSSDAVEIGGGRGKVLKNAPWVLANVTGILTAIGQVITSALVGTAILRDFQHRTHELLFTTAMSRFGYLAGRFGGAFVAMIVVYLAIPVGALVGSVMPWVDHDKMLPVHLMSYLQPFLVIGIVNVLVISALFFVAGALTRSQFVVYTMGIFLLVAWTITAQVTRDLRNDWIAALTDPFALQTFRISTRYWTVAEKNTLLVPLDGYLLWNRLLWIAVASTMVAVTLWAFRFSAQPVAIGWGKRRRAQLMAANAVGADGPTAFTESVGRHAAAKLHAAWSTMQGPVSKARQLWAIARMAFLGMVRQVTFLAIVTVGTVNVIMNAWFATQNNDVVVYPRTYLIAQAVVGGFGLFFVILLTMFVGELVWRERQMGADQIQDAMPVGPGIHLVGRVLGLIAAMALLQVPLVLGGMLVQTLRGYHEYQPLLYVQIVLLVEFPFVLQYALLAFFVHTVVNNKAVGHVLLIAFWVVMIVFNAMGWEHLLYQYGSTAPYTYSEMNGFGHFIPRILAFMAWWTAIAVGLGIVAYLYWVRGTDNSPAVRRAAAQERLRGRTRWWLSGTATAAAAVAVFILWNTNVLHAYRNQKARNHATVQYEKKYKAKFDGMTLPTLVAVDVDADLHPETRSYVQRGTQTYVNRAGRPLDSLVLSLQAYQGEAKVGPDQEVWIDTLAWSRPVKELLRDDANGFAVWRLETPLAPGDTITLRWGVREGAKGFSNRDMRDRMAENGFFVNGQAPIMGYTDQAELSDDDDRKKEKLKARELTHPLEDTAAYRHTYIAKEADWIRFRATVRTAPDQIAIAPGYLERESMQNGRRVFEYRMDAPILDFYAFNSARYAVKKASWRGPVCAYAAREGCVAHDTTVDIAVYYHPGHEYNVDRMILATQKSLDYFARHWAPYQHRQVRIIEFPRYQSFAQSFPNTIPYSEGIGFITDARHDDAGRDLPFAVTAHEVAHQWWAHQVIGADVQGATMLSESLAEYSALMAVEQQYGRHAMERYLREELDWYLRGRGTEAKRETPLMRVEGQGYIRYGKGGLTLYALRDYIGEEALNTALSRFIRAHAFETAPYATTKDLMAEFRAVTPDSLQYLLTDLFETITLWDLKANEATATKRADGKWTVKIDVAAKKLRADSSGAEKEIPVADYVTIGVFGGAATKADPLGKPLYTGRHRLTSAQQTIEVVVAEPPKRAAVDPYHLLVDRAPKDNVKEIDGGT